MNGCSMARFAPAFCVTLALMVVAVSLAGTASPMGGIDVEFGENGISQLNLNGEDIPVFDRHEVSVRYLEGKNDGTGKQVHPPNEERKMVSHRFDADKRTHHAVYPWGRVSITYKSGNGRLDADVTLENTGRKMIFSGDIHLLTFAVPATAYVGHRRHNLDGVGQSITTWEGGGISVCALSSDKPLWVEMGKDDGFLRRTELDTERLRGVTARLKFGGYDMPYDEQYMIRPVSPGQSDRYRVSLRFGAPEADLFATAQDLYSAFAKAHPPRLKWRDRRPIGSMFLKDTPLTQRDIAERFKRWLDEGPDSIRSAAVDEEYRTQMVRSFESNIAGCKAMDAQAMIIWNMEGNTFPHATTYIGDPRLLRVCNPKFDAIADELFSMIEEAGILAGICLRPSQINYELKDGVPTLEQRYGPARDPVLQLTKKVEYARKRWGIRIFYVDTNIFWRLRKGRFDKETGKLTFGSGVMRSDNWAELLKKFPDTLFIPEFAGAPESFAYAMNYEEYDMGFRGTSGRVRRIYPGACSMAVVEDASPFELFDVMVQNVRDGDILRTFSYGINRNVKMIRNIYREAELLNDKCPRAVTRAAADAEKLTKLLVGKDETSRYYAVENMATVTGNAADGLVEPLIRTALDTGENWNVRRVVLLALGKLKDKAASEIPDILEMLKHETLGYFAAMALGTMGPSVLPDVMKLAEKSEGRERTALVDTMGFIGHPKAVALLEKLGAPGMYGHQAVYKALARIGDESSVAALGRLIVLDDMPVYQRGAVATALGDSGNPGAMQVLRDARSYAARKKQPGDGVDWGNFNWRIGNAERHLKAELKRK